jgi:hypothetical protein
MVWTNETYFNPVCFYFRLAMRGDPWRFAGRGNAVRMDVCHCCAGSPVHGNRSYVVGAMMPRFITISVDARTSEGDIVRVSRRFDEVSLARMRDPISFLLETINELQAESSKGLREAEQALRAAQGEP